MVLCLAIKRDRSEYLRCLSSKCGSTLPNSTVSTTVQPADSYLCHILSFIFTEHLYSSEHKRRHVAPEDIRSFGVRRIKDSESSGPGRPKCQCIRDSESRPSAQFTIGESGASATLSAGLHLKASSRAGTTLVAGSVIGGMLALCLVFLCWIIWLRRSLRRRRGTAPSFEFVPMEQSRHIARASFAYPVVEVTEVVTQDLKSEVLPPQPSSGRCTTNHGTLDNLRGRGNRGYHLPLVEEDSREDPSYCNSSESSSRLAAESTAHSHVDSEHIGEAI